MFISGIQSPAFASANQSTRFGMARFLEYGEKPGVDEEVVLIYLPTKTDGRKPGKTKPKRVAHNFVLNRSEREELAQIEDSMESANQFVGRSGKQGNKPVDDNVKRLGSRKRELLDRFLSQARSLQKKSNK